MTKVLMVDAIVPERDTAVRRLERSGFDCITATSSDEALTIAESERPDVIVFDLVMPAMDAFAACRQLKRCEQTADIPVIVLTEQQRVVKESWARWQGADDELSKPYANSELVATINRHL